MNKLTDLSLWANKNKTCNKCGMEKSEAQKKGCCKDENRQVKLNNEHKQIEYFYCFIQLAPLSLTSYFFQLKNTGAPKTSEQFPVSNAPPLAGVMPVYLLFCVFLI
jgi:hypothetical protein